MPKGVYGRKDWVTRFWEKVDKDGPVPPHRPQLGKCWVWTGSTSYGYGQFWLNGTNHKAHRVAYILTHGDIPEEVMVLHRCDNRVCMRDSHHFLGSHQDNMDDRNTKERQSRGEAHTSSKNTDPQIDEIRALWATGDYTQEMLGTMYNRSQSSVSKLVRGIYRKTKAKGC